MSQWFKRLINSGTKRRHIVQRPKTVRLAKYSKNINIKNTSLLINFLFIELLYQINITFVIMLILGEKKPVPLHVI